MSAESNGWADASNEQPRHGRKVLALQPREKDGYTPEAGHTGKPCAWVLARWDVKHNRWGIVDASGRGPLVGERISWWRELPKLPDGVLIVPPDPTE